MQGPCLATATEGSLSRQQDCLQLQGGSWATCPGGELSKRFPLKVNACEVGRARRGSRKAAEQSR